MKNSLENYFKNTDFDIHTPKMGHFERFEQKLIPQKKQKSLSTKWMSIAASIILLFGFWLGTLNQPKQLSLADISSEMKETETFFVNTIQREIKEIEQQRNPTTEKIIEDALNQLEILEDNYQELIAELNTDGKNKRIIYAMISNYQNRIDILKDVLNKIEEINNPNKINYEERFI